MINSFFFVFNLFRVLTLDRKTDCAGHEWLMLHISWFTIGVGDAVSVRIAKYMGQPLTARSRPTKDVDLKFYGSCAGCVRHS